MDRGFTLIEVLIAMVILSITFVWLISAVNRSIDTAVRSKFITTSTLLAQKRIADVLSDDGERSSGVGLGDFGDDHQGYAYTERIEPTPLSGYSKYTLLIKWGEKGNLETEFNAFLSTE